MKTLADSHVWGVRQVKWPFHDGIAPAARPRMRGASAARLTPLETTRRRRGLKVAVRFRSLYEDWPFAATFARRRRVVSTFGLRQMPAPRIPPSRVTNQHEFWRTFGITNERMGTEGEWGTSFAKATEVETGNGERGRGNSEWGTEGNSNPLRGRAPAQTAQGFPIARQRCTKVPSLSNRKDTL